MTPSLSLAMQCYSVQPKDWIYVKDYDFLSFARNIGKIFGKNIRKNVSRKYSQNFLITLSNLLKMHLKLLQISDSKTAKATDELIGNKIADKITRVSETSNSETDEEEILRERFIPSELRHKIIDDWLYEIKDRKSLVF